MSPSEPPWVSAPPAQEPGRAARAVRYGTRWGAIVLLYGALNLGLGGGFDPDHPWDVLAGVVYAPIVALFVLPSAVVAALLWSTLDPDDEPPPHPALVAGLGALAAPLGIGGVFLVEDLASGGGSTLGLAFGEVLPTMLVNGGVAGLLARPRDVPRSFGWWVTLLVGGVVGLSSLMWRTG